MCFMHVKAYLEIYLFQMPSLKEICILQGQ